VHFTARSSELPANAEHRLDVLERLARLRRDTSVERLARSRHIADLA